MYHSGWDCLGHDCSHQHFTLDGQFGNWRCDTCSFLFVWLVWRRQFCAAFHCVVSCSKRPRMARKPQYWQSVCYEQLLDRKEIILKCKIYFQTFDILTWKPLPHIITKSPSFFWQGNTYPATVSFLIVALLVEAADCAGGSSLTVMRGIGGAANSDDCSGSGWSIFICNTIKDLMPNNSAWKQTDRKNGR